MKRTAYFIIIVVLALVGTFIISRSYLNYDNVGKGKLKSVSVTYNFCLEVACTAEQPMLITDPVVLKKLQSVFFTKVSSNLVEQTKEEGRFNFKFEFEKQIIDFNVSIDFAMQVGKIKYFAKHRDYGLTKADITYLATIIK